MLTNIGQRPRITPRIRGFHASSQPTYLYLLSGVPKPSFSTAQVRPDHFFESASTFDLRGTGADCDCAWSNPHAFLLQCLGQIVMVRKYETYTFSSSKFFADRGTEGVAQPLTERVNVSAV
jgi:hypothetical protein